MSDCCTSIYGLKKQQVRRQEDNMGKNIDWSNLGFGYVKTDYRYVSNFKNGAWDEGTLSTDDMVTISECACVLQYAQTVFEGMKAYTTEDGRIVVFRPDLNAERMENSAKRLEMPVFPKDRFVDAIVKLVEANADYVPPYGSGATLYIRPYMFGTNAVIGVKPADEYQFRAFCTPVGPYFKGGVKPITIRVSDFDRAAPRGTGHIKAGLNYAMSLHAIMDALLGAAALGDIGKHFPDTDPQYKGISSIRLLEHVAKLIEEKGYIVENIDATIIAQKPKMRPYIEEMEKNIATALHIDVSQVNVKATTEEGLGFTGTEQGISSQAICALTTIYESSVAVADSQAGCEGCAGCRKQS